MTILQIVETIFEKFPTYTGLIMDMIASGKAAFDRFKHLFSGSASDPTPDQIKAAWDSWDQEDPIK